MAIPATYVSDSSFYIDGEYDNEYPVGRKIQANIGVDGTSRSAVASASYNSGTDRTTVVLKSGILTVNLVSISKGVGDATSIGLHYHTGDDDAGAIAGAQLTQEQVEQLPILPVPDPGGADDGKVLGIVNAQWTLVLEGLSVMASIQESITQADHGFAVGDVIGRDGATNTYVKAQADTVVNAEAVGIVQSVNGAVFVVVYGGRINGLSGLTDGATYYLSEITAGALTATEPDTDLYVSKPMLIATSATSGVVMNMRGLTVGAP